MGLGKGKTEHSGPRDMTRKEGHWGYTEEAKDTLCKMAWFLERETAEEHLSAQGEVSFAVAVRGRLLYERLLIGSLGAPQKGEQPFGSFDDSPEIRERLTELFAPVPGAP